MTEIAEITQVAVVVLEDTNMLSLAAAVDPLRAANRQAGRTLYRWRLLTPGPALVTLTTGVNLPANPLSGCLRCDVLIVVAGFGLERQAQSPLLAGLRRLSRTAELVAGIDGGPWLMARAGLLDGRRATTHWEDLESFSTTFPQVDVVNARYIISGKMVTSGGAAPAIDLMLHLIARRNGAALAAKVAGSFIHDTDSPADRPQQHLSLRGARSELLARAHAAMIARLDDPLPLSELARSLGVSPRRLQAHFQQHMKKSPQAHYLWLRLSEAERRVTETAEPLQQIALATGFSSQSAFARAFRRAFGTSARSRRRKTRQSQ